ncbi:glycerol kinase GlpK [Marispirochaeta aestuarii]|uniref:glycerol kinase GlpK n=1 Tax=Marispirochaeta aestuarii TaxID=1963862 RepID=UPI002ABE661D|nr:glycerol kinase GlpK [Marispirochaeta aestuarii]
MSVKKYIGAIDQGTTSTRFILFDHAGQIKASHLIEHRQYYPQAGWVEHDALEIWENTQKVIRETLRKAEAGADDIAAIGITNQRETTVVWDKETGKPYGNALVWQDTRTAQIIEDLSRDGDMDCFREKIGLPLATYFSGPKLKWILDNIPEAMEGAKNGKALFGTMDSWVVWWLTGGPMGGSHITDVTNASRTMLMNIHTISWDTDMLEVMGVPSSILPEIKSSSDPEFFGYTREDGPFGGKIPVAGILGDQQAALFGQTCFVRGEAKSTYGTGGFLLLNTGTEAVQSKHGLITTVGYKIGDQPTIYALEGSIAVAGSLVQWFRDNLKMIKEAPEINDLAEEVEDNGGIYIVPAFSGLFAPYWNSSARGIVAGLTHFVTRSHLARAVLEATAYQVAELIESMEKDSGVALAELKVDGGMVASNLLMQFQSDILNSKVIRPEVIETTALGAAYAAGLAVGFWRNQDDLCRNWKVGKCWEPQMHENQRKKLLKGWKKAVQRTMEWVD